MHEEDAPGMAIDLLRLDKSKPTSSPFSLQPVQDIETLRMWGRIVTLGFGMPEFTAQAMVDFFASLGFGEPLQYRNYLGWLNGEPVATSSLFLGRSRPSACGVGQSSHIGITYRKRSLWKRQSILRGQLMP